ncbi:hypothetical protein [Alicyclobacillus tolerans]|uniref:hypothetical protein n=1 Tax=Alicyclobacillus tolerans TaxID=90970 RepID=UPI003B986336
MGFECVCPSCDRVYEHADFNFTLSTYRKEMERLKERNSNLASVVGIFRAQNKIMREALEVISRGAADANGQHHPMTMEARDALEHIDKTMESFDNSIQPSQDQLVTEKNVPPKTLIWEAIITERQRQNRLHPSWHGNDHGLVVLAEEFGEVAKALYELKKTGSAEYYNACDKTEWGEEIDFRLRELKDELIQVAAVCVRWLENIEDAAVLVYE